MPTIIPQWVPNTPVITLPSNLIYTDINGNPVYTLYPYQYLVLVGQQTNNLVSQYNVVNSQISTINTEIANLFILTSGITAPYVTPQINAQCLANGCSGCTSQPIDVVLEELVNAWCIYRTVTGTNSQLLSAIVTECPNLNSSASFTNPIASMSALSGWIPTPLTEADTLTNIWLTLCDARVGIQKAIATITPTCSQIDIGFVAQMQNFGTGINFYFQGYTFIPTGFIDGGSILVITDDLGGIVTQPINIITLSNTPGAYTILTSGSTLSPYADKYTVTLTTIVTNSSIGLTCQKTTLGITGIPITAPFSSISASSGVHSAPALPCGTCLPAVRANNDLYGLSSGSTILTYTQPIVFPAILGTFQINGYANLLSGSGGTMTFYTSFVDENGVSQTVISFTTTVTPTPRYSTTYASTIRAKLGTLITTFTTLAGGAIVTYDSGCTIIQIA